jgi:Ni,Fe-hydrogenase I small subunit
MLWNEVGHYESISSYNGSTVSRRSQCKCVAPPASSGDLNGLLEYALLLAELEASQRSQIHWLVREACSGIGRATGGKEPTVS